MYIHTSSIVGIDMGEKTTYTEIPTYSSSIIVNGEAVSGLGSIRTYIHRLALGRI
jgi:CTP-dependent riboflavin kinase